MKKLFLTSFFFFLLPFFSQAFSTEVIVDTGNISINALEATIHMPEGVSVEKVYDGNSVILFWIKAPVYDSQSQAISFSGITPGGFSGERMVLSFSGELTVEDLSHFTFSEVRALKNDGLGESVAVRLFVQPTEIAEDRTPPEPFKPIISSSSDVFDGQRFLSFATQDKGTGIEHYEYVTTWLFFPRDSDWLETKSPIALSRTMLFKKIYIRAVDKSGNYREVFTVGPYYYATLVISIIILLCVLSFSKRFVWPRS